jgi:hypothetical protein
MAGEHERAWLRAIGKKLRDDLGDCPTLPDELLELLERIKDAQPGQEGRMRRDRPGPATSTGSTTPKK